MSNEPTIPSLTEAKAYIDTMDFSPIIHKMVHHQGWREKDAQTICTMYRRFLYLNKKYGDSHKIPPSEDIDEFWHLHILDTHRYRQDCDAIFGKYFDHYPYFGIDEKSTFTDLEGAFQTMMHLYEKEFGEGLYQVRGIFSKVVSFFKLALFTKKPQRVAAAT